MIKFKKINRYGVNMKRLNQLDMKKKKYIIFDMDGTLIDSIGVWNTTDQRLILKYTNKYVDETTI